jgi:hypothetical protein
MVTIEENDGQKCRRVKNASTSSVQMGLKTLPFSVNLPIYSRHDCILFTAHNDMARIYPSLSLLCILILALLQSLVSAHMIEVVAGKKECFFEDLHVNDKVCMLLLLT